MMICIQQGQNIKNTLKSFKSGFLHSNVIDATTWLDTKSLIAEFNMLLMQVGLLPQLLILLKY